jgi:serine/threonine protein kinase
MHRYCSGVRSRLQYTVTRVTSLISRLLFFFIPENILCVTRDNHIQVKLTDFGLAKIINEDDSLKTFCGTPQYFAPEVLRRRHTVAGRGRYGKPADMWSLGVILYILLSGQPPFNPDNLDNDEEDDRAQYDIQFPSDPWSQFHPHAVDLVQKLLREDPKRRLSVSQACTHPWILMEDGDTHIHPLDDPNLTTRKKLFGSPEQQQHQPPLQEGEQHEEKSYHMATDEASHSTKDEDCCSILSKESFSAAAQAMSHRRNDSVFDVVVGNTLPQAVHQDDDDTKKSTTTPMEDDDGDDTPAEVVSSPNEQTLVTSGSLGELSVTPSEASGTPRSPLAAMSLNERSNRFREQILIKTSSNSPTRSPKNSDEDDDDPNPSPTREQQGMDRPAVTPTVSNIRKHRESSLQQPVLVGAAELEEDEICSRFSDQTESLQSFPSSHADSPVAAFKQPEAEESSVRKRLRADTESASAAAPESPKRKQQRQMTLSGWFVKKTTPASTGEKETGL